MPLRPLLLPSLILCMACGDSNGAGGPGDSGVMVDSTAPVDARPPVDAAADGATADAIAVDAGPTLPATITVSPGKPIGAVGPAFVGLSYEKSHLEDGYFRGSNAALVAMFDLLGPSLLRVGGNSVDSSVWQTYDAGAPGDAAAPSVITSADVDGLAAFAKAANWKVLYGVNMKLSSPSLAATEATYAATALGSSLYGFEIGNECDLYTTVVSSPGTWNLSAFVADWQKFQTAMHAATPGSPFTGPASATHVTSWTVPFAGDEAATIELLTQHYYVANGKLPTSTIDLLLSPDPALVTQLQALKAAADAHSIPNHYRLAECNSFYGGGAPNVSDAYGTALWAIDFLFTNAQNGSTGVNFHGGGNGPGYTPIADSKGNVVEARPIFYGMLLFTMAGQGSVLTTSGAPTSIRFSAYAIATSKGTSVILSNKDKTTTVHATVDVGASVASAGATRLQGPSLDSNTGVTVGGVAIGADGSFAPNAPESLATSGSTFTVDVPPASAVLVLTK